MRIKNVAACVFVTLLVAAPNVEAQPKGDHATITGEVG
jgi:hypothetical protein